MLQPTILIYENGAADKGYLTIDDMPTISDIIIAIGRNDGTLEINESSSALRKFWKSG